MNSWIGWFLSLLCIENRSKTYIEPKPEPEIDTELIDSYRTYGIMRIIRNGIPLDDEELLFVKTLSREQLIEIIEINNKNISMFHTVINK